MTGKACKTFFTSIWGTWFTTLCTSSAQQKSNSHKFYLVPPGKVSRLGNAVKIQKWIYKNFKNKIVIISSIKNLFRPQLYAQIVAGVETHRYSLVLGHGDHFWQSYEENQVQKIRHRIHRTIQKTAKSIFVPKFSILPKVNRKFSRFGASRSCQVLKISSSCRGEPKSSIWQ